MKNLKYLLIIFLLTMTFNSKSQNNVSLGILSSGGVESNGENYTNYSVVGDVFVNYYITVNDYENSIGFLEYVDSLIPGLQTILGTNDLTIYPNPTNEYLNISGNLLQNKSFKIYDIFGNLIYSDDLKQEIDMSSFASGIYFLKLINKYNRIEQIEKIIKM